MEYLNDEQNWRTQGLNLAQKDAYINYLDNLILERIKKAFGQDGLFFYDGSNQDHHRKIVELINTIDNDLLEDDGKGILNIPQKLHRVSEAYKSRDHIIDIISNDNINLGISQRNPDDGSWIFYNTKLTNQQKINYIQYIRNSPKTVIELKTELLNYDYKPKAGEKRPYINLKPMLR